MCTYRNALESAIPPHLHVARTIEASCPPQHEPPYPTFVARFPEHVRQFAIVYLGVQYLPSAASSADAARKHIRELLAGADGPRHFDESRFEDGAGHDNWLFAAYWDDVGIYRRWAQQGPAAAWWADDERLKESIGYYREAFLPQAPALETHFSTHRAEGLAVLGTAMSGEIEEHAYWGGARDRIPLAQTDALAPGPMPGRARGPADSARSRCSLRANENLCLIRSGQDWSDTDAAEKALFDRAILPHLTNGMDYLRDKGTEDGCFENRFVTCVDQAGHSIDKSYGVSIWRSLGDLERWAATHPTHLAIFGAGGAYMRKLGSGAGLRTYHEICIVSSAEQEFDYICCHLQTGLLKFSFQLLD